MGNFRLLFSTSKEGLVFLVPITLREKEHISKLSLWVGTRGKDVDQGCDSMWGCDPLRADGRTMGAKGLAKNCCEEGCCEDSTSDLCLLQVRF